jgi:hypothetical protein
MLLPGGFIMANSKCSLPRSFLKEIQDCLLGADEEDENSNIRLSLSEDKVQKYPSHVSNSHYQEIPFHSSMITTELSSMPQSVLKFFDDLGCQQYVEEEVIQVEMIEAPIRFASLVDGILVYETRFFRDCPSHKDLYDIQVLRSMDGVSGNYSLNWWELSSTVLGCT